MIRKKNDEAMRMDEDITSLNKHLQEKQVTFLHFVTMETEAKFTNVAVRTCSCFHNAFSLHKQCKISKR